MVDINKKVDREDRNTEIVSKAIDDFNIKLEDPNLTDTERVRIFQELTRCYIIKKDFAGIEGILQAEIKSQADSPKNAGKRVWAEHLLSSVYSAWLQLYPTRGNYSTQLTLLKQAYSYNPTVN